MEKTTFTMRQMVEAGMHFGHTTRRCNPKMLPWIFGQRNGIHIIDLQQSYGLMRQALASMQQIAAENGKVLFVGTKRQAQTVIAETAKSCGQFYINRRWLGGTLTNWQTVSKSIQTLKDLEEKLDIDEELKGLTKKEKLTLTRHKDKLERALGGIREMSGLPDLLFVIDTNKEATAIKEAQHLSIPIAAILDSNSNPDGIDFPIPGNDDAIRSLQFYCSLIASVMLTGIEQSLVHSKKEQEKTQQQPEQQSKQQSKQQPEQQPEQQSEQQPEQQSEQQPEQQLEQQPEQQQDPKPESNEGQDTDALHA